MKNFTIDTEDFVFIILIICSVLNIIGNNYVKNSKKDIANKYFLTSLIVTIIIYFYFLYKYYNIYNNCLEKDKNVFSIKLFGLSFLIVGAFCLIIFQIKNPDIELAPVL